MKKKPYQSKNDKQKTVGITDQQAFGIAVRNFTQISYVVAASVVKEMFNANEDQIAEFIKRLHEGILKESQRANVEI